METNRQLPNISIHAPTRGATKLYRLAWCQFAVFQSTLPREERHISQSLIGQDWVFQSTLPREERPLPKLEEFSYLNFNPRSHERSDAQFLSKFLYLLYFNPRSHERSDGGKNDSTGIFAISIHAPTRGATRDSRHLSCRFQHFNPRSHERSDLAPLFSDGSLIVFQSTLPREERRERRRVSICQ